MDLVKFHTLKQLLKREGKLELRVASNSMNPVLRAGDLIYVKPVNHKELKKFDIIVFWQQERIMCHFLWQIQRENDQDVFITKSLENPKEIDFPIREDLLLGKLKLNIPFYLKLIVWLKNLNND